MTARLIRLDWPDFGQPDLPPPFSLDEARGRLAALRGAMAGRFDAVVVYGDREHAANIHWLTGFDPRFEEALLVVTAEDALLVAGNECLPYTQVSPLVAAGDVGTVHCATLSLPSQPRKGRRLDECLADMLPKGGRIGAVGWKLFEPHEVPPGRDVPLDLPGFVTDAITLAAGVTPTNATALMMDPGAGLRSVVDAAEIARLEFCQPHGGVGAAPDGGGVPRGDDGFRGGGGGGPGRVAAVLSPDLCDRHARGAGAERADGRRRCAQGSAISFNVGALGVEHLPGRVAGAVGGRPAGGRARAIWRTSPFPTCRRFPPGAE